MEIKKLKKAMEFRLGTFILGVLIFMLIIVSMAIPYGSISSGYQVKVDSKFNETFNKIGSIKQNVTQPISDTIKEEKESAADTFFLAAKTVLSVPKIMFGMIGASIGLITATTEELGIPPIFQTVAIILITLAVALFAISIWARYKA